MLYYILWQNVRIRNEIRIRVKLKIKRVKGEEKEC